MFKNDFVTKDEHVHLCMNLNFLIFIISWKTDWFKRFINNVQCKKYSKYNRLFLFLIDIVQCMIYKAFTNHYTLNVLPNFGSKYYYIFEHKFYVYITVTSKFI